MYLAEIQLREPSGNATTHTHAPKPPHTHCHSCWVVCRCSVDVAPDDLPGWQALQLTGDPCCECCAATLGPPRLVPPAILALDLATAHLMAGALRDVGRGDVGAGLT